MKRAICFCMIWNVVMDKRDDWYMDNNMHPNILLLHPSDYNDLAKYLHRNGMYPYTDTGQYFFNGMELISSFSEKQGVPRLGIIN